MDTIRLVSWNVNGFRALSGKPDWDWFATTDADVVRKGANHLRLPRLQVGDWPASRLSAALNA